MKKTLLGLALASMCLCACNSKASNENQISKDTSGSVINNETTPTSSEVNNSETENLERPSDWYSPIYHEYYQEPRFYESVLEFNYKDETSKQALFDHLKEYGGEKYIKSFPIPLDSSITPEHGVFYPVPAVSFHKEEYKRVSLNFKFEIKESYKKYDMSTDYYEQDVDYIRVSIMNEIVLEKYYKAYTDEEITKEEFLAIQESKGHWKSHSHWIGNFVPDDEYKSSTKFDIYRVFNLCSKMFCSYDSNRELDKVRIYQKTPSNATELKIVGLD